MKSVSLDYRSAGDETIDDHDYSDDEQKMDQPSTHVHDKEPKNPKDKENYRDGPKHGGILARSELRLARLAISRAAAHTNPACAFMLGDTGQDGNEHA
jgi:hypothetical protein